MYYKRRVQLRLDLNLFLACCSITEFVGFQYWHNIEVVNNCYVQSPDVGFSR